MNIEGNPYPWSEAIARDLHRRLAETFYEPPEVRTLVKSAGKPDALAINFNQPPLRVWVEVLDKAAAQGGVSTLLTFIADNTSVGPELVTFIRELLAQKSPAAKPTVGAKDAPAVQPLTQPEALLFGHDLSESVGEIPDLLTAIANVMKWRSSVCHLKVSTATGDTFLGSGTLLAGNRILTNHHVMVPNGADATAVSVIFNYELDAKGQNLASVAIDGDIASLKLSKDDDWATFAIAAPPAGIEAFDLAANQAVAKVKDRAFILQHPNGAAKRLAFVRNHVSSVEDRRVRYVTDTEGGSSGSPVFNADGKMIALHRAGGIPQKFAGVPAVKNNEGVRIDVIAASILQV